MKKIFKILAVTVAAAGVVGMAGCTSSSSGISLDSFWFIDTYPGIQNSAIGTEEVLKYDVTLDEDTQGNTSYHMTLDTEKEHSFVTKFGVGVYNWDNQGKDGFTKIDSTNAATYTVGSNAEVVYYLETSLVYSGAFVLGDTTVAATADNSVSFDDEITTVTYFRSAQKGLTPLYSYSYVHTTSPNTYTAADTVSAMCAELNYEYEVFYDKGCTQATYYYRGLANTEAEDAEKTNTLSDLDDLDYTVFDNNQLYAAIRGMNLSADFSETISLVIPANGGVTDVSVTGADAGTLDSSDENQAKIIAALEAQYGQAPAATDDSTGGISYNPVSITTDSDYSGITQTAWFAAVEDENDNQYRATLLYLAIPMSYDLGTLEYTLTEVSSVIAPDGQYNV
ncbi:MAG: hypothetical protein LUI60_06850 [Clostridia bacterium]|nr:hypothetical protein [Clostridia bacterium]